MGNSPYMIQLQRNKDGQLTIINAESSLLDYIAEQGLLMTDEHLPALADLGSVLGYTVEEPLWQELETLCGSDVVVFMKSRTYELLGDFGQIDRLVRYAQLVNRMPMVIYDPSPTPSYEKYLESVGEQGIYKVANTRTIDTDSKIIWSHRTVKELSSIPLLVSHIGIIAGAEKQIMVQNSQKIIYFNQRLS
jgi:hypothetical protein